MGSKKLMANNQQAYSFYCSVKVGGAPYIQVRSIVRNLGTKEERKKRLSGFATQAANVSNFAATACGVEGLQLKESRSFNRVSLSRRD